MVQEKIQFIHRMLQYYIKKKTLIKTNEHAKHVCG